MEILMLSHAAAIQPKRNSLSAMLSLFLFLSISASPAGAQDPSTPQTQVNLQQLPLANPADTQSIQPGQAAQPTTQTPTPTELPPALDNALKNFRPGQEPVVVPPITFVDVNSGRFGKLEIDLEDGQFLDAAVDKLHMVARNLDVRDGLLKSLAIDVKGGHLHDFIFDSLSLNTQSDMHFDTGIFLNHRMLQFSQPAQAEVTATISQDSLNQYLNSPVTLQHISVTAGRRANAIAGMLGMANVNIGLTVSKAGIILGKSNKVALTFISSIGMGQMGVPIEGEIDGKLSLKDGWLDISDTHILTGGQELPPQISETLIKRINDTLLGAQKSNDIHFTFTELKVVSGKQILLKGTAQVSRLRFG
jgi:hypothetical protein